MKKNTISFITLIAVILAAAAAGCRKNSPAEPAAPTGTITASATKTNTPYHSATCTKTVTVTASITETSTITHTITPTNTVLINVQAIMMTSNGSDQAVVYIDVEGTPFPEATVLVNGTPVPYDGDSGSSSTYRLTNTVPYAYGQSFTFSISAFGLTAVDTTPDAPGDVTIPDDGITISWLYDGELDRLQVYSAGMVEIHNAPTDIDSPYIIPSGIYGTGNYQIHVVIEKYKTGNMNNPLLINSSSLRVYDYHYRTITK